MREPERASLDQLGAELKPEEMDLLSGAMERVEISAGEELAVQGVRSDRLMLSVEGELGLFTDAGEHEMEIGRVSCGHWVGGIDMIEPAPAILGIRALTDGRILTLSHASFMELRRSDPALTLKLLRTLSNELGIRLQEYSCRAIERPETRGDREEGSEHHGWLKKLLGTFSGERRSS